MGGIDSIKVEKCFSGGWFTRVNASGKTTTGNT
jgi:hypothetical protein